MTDREKRLAIQEALDELQQQRGDKPAGPYEPLETRFFEALNLLAEGGHDYSGAPDVAEAPDNPTRSDRAS